MSSLGYNSLGIKPGSAYADLQVAAFPEVPCCADHANTKHLCSSWVLLATVTSHVSLARFLVRAWIIP